LEVQHSAREDEMGGGRDGKELGDGLHQAENEGDDDVRHEAFLFFRRDFDQQLTEGYLLTGAAVQLGDHTVQR